MGVCFLFFLTGIRIHICFGSIHCVISYIVLFLVLQIWDAIQSGAALKDPSILCRFILLTFAVRTNTNLRSYLWT